MTVQSLFYKLEDLAGLLGLAVSTVRTRWRLMVKAGRIPPPVGVDPPRWRRDQVDAFFARQGADALAASGPDRPARAKPGRPPRPDTPQPRGTLVALMRAGSR